jgi:hypothetical protein
VVDLPAHRRPRRTAPPGRLPLLGPRYPDPVPLNRAEPRSRRCAAVRLRGSHSTGPGRNPLERTLAAADSGNDVSAVLDWDRYLFVNTDLTVTLHRQPAGEWVCLDAVTHPQPHGIGLAESALFDEKGPLGRGTQTLFLGPR